MTDSEELSLGQIACFEIASRLPTLVSVTGYHCVVWRCVGTLIENKVRTPIDCVVKKFTGPCSFNELTIYHKQYQLLRSTLEELIPRAVFIQTEVDAEISAIVLAETVIPWFNIANPNNEDEAIPMFRKLRPARDQLRRFVAAARDWHNSDNSRVIDLYGLDNLVLNTDYKVKYVDSFSVFFNEDLLHITGEADEALRLKIETSLQRLEYLEYVLESSN